MKDPMQRLDHMLEDLRDTSAALRGAAGSARVERCGCGCFTLRAPCPKCAREAAEKDGKEKGKP